MEVGRSMRRQQRRPARFLAFAAGAAAVVTCGTISFVGIPRSSVATQPQGQSDSLSRSTVPRAAAVDVEDWQDAKSQLLDMLVDEDLRKEVLRADGKPMRGRVDELIVQLERFNPNDEPAYSEEIDGKWVIAYTGTYAPGFLSSPTRELALFLYGGGFSLGSVLTSFLDGFWGEQIGIVLASKKVEISFGRDVEAEAEIILPGDMKETLRYKAEMMPLSACRISEEVVSFQFPEPIGSRDTPFELRRNILITYLDEDTMIVRDESGVPEVLTREVAPVELDDAATEGSVYANVHTGGAADEPSSVVEDTSTDVDA